MSPSSIPKKALLFCKITVLLILILALALRIKLLAIVAFLIFLFSAILGIKKAPLIALYQSTLAKVMKSKEELVYVPELRFAHILGSIISFISILYLYFIDEQIGWIILFIMAVLKIGDCFGFCLSAKLYKLFRRINK
jgi:hypothetical protein